MANKAYKDLTLRISADGKTFKKDMRDVNREMAKFKSEFNRSMKNLKIKFNATEAINAIKNLNRQIETNSTKILKYSQQIRKSESNIKKLSDQSNKLKDAIKGQKLLIESLTSTYGKNSEQTKNAKAKLKDLEDTLKNTDRTLKNESKSLETNKRYLQNAELQAARLNDKQKALNRTLKQLDPSSVNKLSTATVKAAENYQKLKEKASSANGSFEDSKRAISALNTLIEKQTALDKALRNESSKVWQDSQSQINKAKTALAKNNDEINKSVQKEKEFKNELSKVGQGSEEYKKLTNAIKDQQTHTQTLKQQTNSLKGVIRTTTSEAKSNVDKVNTAIKSNSDALNKSKGELGRYSSNWRNKFRSMATSTKEPRTKLDALTNHVKRLDSTLGAVRFGFFGTLGSKAFGLITSAAKFTGSAIIDSSNRLSDFEKASRALGESDKQIQSEETSLQKYAETTRYSMNDMLSLFQQVRGTGVPNAEKLTQSIGNIATVTGATNDQLYNFTKDANEAFAAGVLHAAQWNGMVRDMPDASAKVRQQIVKDLHISNSQFKEAMSQGKISSKELQRALMEVGQDKSVLKQATKITSLKQGLDAISESVQDNLGKLGQKFSGPFTQATVHAGDKIDDLFAKIMNGTNSSKSSQKELTKELDKAIDTIYDAIVKVISWIKNNWPTIKQLLNDAKTAIKTVSSLIFSLLKFMANHKKTVVALVASFLALKGVVGTLNKVATAMENMKTIGKAIHKVNLLQIADNIKMLATNPYLLLAAAIATVVTGLVLFFTKTKTGQKLAKKIGKWFTDAWHKISKEASKLWKDIQRIFKPMAGFFKATWNAVVDIIKHVWNIIVAYFQFEYKVTMAIWTPIIKFFEGIFKGIWNFLKPILKSMTKGFSDAWKEIKKVWSVVKNWFKKVWNGIWNALKPVINFVKKAWAKAWAEIKKVWNKVKPYFGRLWNAIKAIFKPVKDILSGYFRLAWHLIKEIWTEPKTFFNNVFHFITHPFSTIKSVFHKYFGQAADDIKAIFNGVVDWFTGLPGRIMGAIGNLGSQIKNSIMGGLGKVGSLIGLSGNGLNYQMPTMNLAPNNLAPHNKSIYNNGGNTINVYAAQGQDTRELAQEIQRLMIRGV